MRTAVTQHLASTRASCAATCELKAGWTLCPFHFTIEPPEAHGELIILAKVISKLMSS